MLTGKTLIAPTMDPSANSDPFDVDSTSAVCYLKPSAGIVLTEDDTFQLARQIDDDPDRFMPVVDDGSGILMGANNTQVEVLIRGTYRWEKILATTESVGLYRTFGLEEE